MTTSHLRRLPQSIAIVAVATAVLIGGVPAAMGLPLVRQIVAPDPIPTVPVGVDGALVTDTADGGNAFGEAPVTSRLGDPCTADLRGLDSLDITDGTRIRCELDTERLRWIRVEAGTLSDDPTAIATGRGGYQAGLRCTPNGNGSPRETVEPGTGLIMRCDLGGEGWFWVRQVRANYVPPPPPTIPELPASDRISPPPDLCTPTGLPDGFALPAGAVIDAGYPLQFESDDRLYKNNRCRIEARIAGLADREVIEAHFAGQCAANGWLYSPLTTGRYEPSPNERRIYSNPSFPFGPGSMLIGSCRTAEGGLAPWEILPWYLNWSITVYDDGTPAELMVELRARYP